MGSTTKQCSKCGVEKELEGFSRKKTGKFGRRSRCKACMAEYNRRYREENREARLEYNRRYHEENREAQLEYFRRYHEENREAQLEYFRRYREENREAQLEYFRRWRKENPHRVAEAKQRRRARKLGNGVEPYRRLDIFERDNWICQLCGKPIDPDANYWNDDGTVNTQYRSIDHIIPFAKGGPDAPHNVQAAHLGCNISKGDRTENDNGNSHA